MMSPDNILHFFPNLMQLGWWPDLVGVRGTNREFWRLMKESSNNLTELPVMKLRGAFELMPPESRDYVLKYVLPATSEHGSEILSTLVCHSGKQVLSCIVNNVLANRRQFLHNMNPFSAQFLLDLLACAPDRLIEILSEMSDAFAETDCLTNPALKHLARGICMNTDLQIEQSPRLNKMFEHISDILQYSNDETDPNLDCVVVVDIVESLKTELAHIPCLKELLEHIPEILQYNNGETDANLDRFAVEIVKNFKQLVVNPN